jgi:DNA-binding MarR family transcriptional regulator
MKDVPDPVAAPSLEAAVVELSTAIGQLRRRMRAAAGSDELSLSQIATLVRLEKAAWMTTADLARAESMKPQSMGAILANLEEDGLVERRPHPTDGRQVEFALTPRGAEARRRRSAAKHAWLLGAISTLTPAEQKTLIAAIALFKRLGAS